ncbi:MAG: Na+/H+ antiporter NhaC family protein [Prevotellaceae bacterium]|nr:Na+/H+ antiporter NhaC family protein [Prevotellaceae bacterium]
MAENQESTNSTNQISLGDGLLKLSPLIVFVVLYLVTSIVAGDFYKIPITVAFMLSSIYAIAIFKGMPLDKRIEVFSRGAGQKNMMLMIWIFVLAGAFAKSAKDMGSIDATVNLTLSVLPTNMLLAGLFLAACFISLSVGTSVGTIAALTPIAVGIANSTGSDVALLTAIVVGGSFFGDNLSFISDTTVVATQTQGCRMSDKFKANIRIVAPIALISFIIYMVMGRSLNIPTAIPDVELIKIVPYLFVLVIALYGVNVLMVLSIGILLTGIIGMTSGNYDFFAWFSSMGEGILSMGELIIVTMMAGGLLELIKENGGIVFIINKITRWVKGRRGAELSIGILVSLVNVCTANNTVAIITVGGIAKDIAERFGIQPKRAASILDTFSCTTQGLLPYVAQVLIASGLATANPINIIGYLYYPMLLGIGAVIYIFVSGRAKAKA